MPDRYDDYDEEYQEEVAQAPVTEAEDFDSVLAQGRIRVTAVSAFGGKTRMTLERGTTLKEFMRMNGVRGVNLNGNVYLPDGEIDVILEHGDRLTLHSDMDGA